MHNGRLQQRLRQVCYRNGPFLADIALGKAYKPAKCGVCRKDAIGLYDLTNLTVATIHGIVGVDDLTDGRGLLKRTVHQSPKFRLELPTHLPLGDCRLQVWSWHDGSLSHAL